MDDNDITEMFTPEYYEKTDIDTWMQDAFFIASCRVVREALPELNRSDVWHRISDDGLREALQAMVAVCEFNDDMCFWEKEES